MAMAHILDNWKPYLSEDDFKYLINYVENCKNNLPNDKVIILLGNGRNGKTTLVSEISNYIGNENVIHFHTNGSDFIEPIVKLIHIQSIDEYNKKYIQQLKNVIQYGQSIITESYDIQNINKNLLDCARIIKMEHNFMKTY